MVERNQMRNHIKLPEFVIFTGPMWSGKTTRLVSEVERHVLRSSKNKDFKILNFKSSIDDRYANNRIVTHTGLSIECIPVKDGNQVYVNAIKHKANIVAVDEAFMIPGIGKVLLKLFREGVTIYVSSIDLMADLTPCYEIATMLPYATRIEKCTSICNNCGNDAYYTNRKTPSENAIQVGGENNYEPMCFQCHPGFSCAF
jgi:thymidine kinase